jgi:hypothetical protein
MTAVDDILSRIPLADLAARLGVDQATAEEATRQALPALLGGIQANTVDPGGAASFASAVRQHDNDLVEGGVNLDDVDENDGERIVGHVFGDQRGQVVRQLGTTGGTSTTSDLMGKLLPILAPIVMATWPSGWAVGRPRAGRPAGSATSSGASSGAWPGSRAGSARGSRVAWVTCSAGRSATCWAVCWAAAVAPDPASHTCRSDADRLRPSHLLQQV